MRIRYSRKLAEDLQHSVLKALATHGIVNIPVLAEQVRQRNEVENVALEDIIAALMAQAQRFNAAMVFDSEAS